MRRSTTLLACFVFTLAAAGVAWADEYTGATGSNYNVGTNWSGGTVPDSDDLAYIRNGATVTVNSSVSSPIALWIGGTGVLVDPNDPNLGYVPKPPSALHVLPGAVLTTTTGSLIVAQRYDGSVSQTGGSVAVPYFGIAGSGTLGHGTYTLAEGTMIMDYHLRPGEATYTMDIGRGGGTGKFIQTGGYVALINNSNFEIGYTGEADRADSVGEFTMTNGSIQVTAGEAFNIGRSRPGYCGQGSFTMYGGTVICTSKMQVGYRGTGVFNQYGGLVIYDKTEPFLLGQTDADHGRGEGTYNLSAGSFYVGGLATNGLRVGSKYSATFGTGTGLVNVSGGILTSVVTVSVGSKGGRGTFLCSNGLVDAPAIILADAVNTSSTVKSEGFMRISGGSVAVTGFSGIVVGANGPGRLEVTGGQLRSVGNIKLGNIDAAYGNGTGELKVGADAVVSSEWGLSVSTTGAKMEMEVASATKNSKVTSEGSMSLGSGLATLAVNSPGYRPREGDKFTLLTATSGITGSFSSITSNITRGLPGGVAFTGAITGTPASYVVTFAGLTSGDANGDHKVDGSDLALMGGAWMKTGQTWATCEFTGDVSGLVDGSDLALMGGNWMWVKPAPAPGGETALPEPATLALLSLGAVGLIRRRRA